MKLRFSKMHGCGNDFVIVDGRKTPDLQWSNLAQRLLDRRFGIGGDQFLVLFPSRVANVRMAIYERDGRESEMCGNGTRCVARLLKEQGEVDQRVSLETLGGIKTIEIESEDRFRVDMGDPIFEPGKIPVTGRKPVRGTDVRVGSKLVRLYALSMGNPHAVMFTDTIDDLAEIQELGPAVESLPLFPNRTNVELVFPRDEKNLAARIWERGAGETFACGTGASALAVVAIREGKAVSPVNVHFKGGTLEIAWSPGSPVIMTGPATHVFSGEVEI